MNIDIIVLNVVIIFHNSFVKLSIPFWLKNIINQRTEWSLNRTSQKNPLTWRSLSDRRTRTRTPPFNKVSQKLSFYLSSAFSSTLPNFSPLTNRQNEIDKRARITRKKKNHHTREAGPSSPRGPTQLLLLRRPPFKHRVYRYRSPRCFNFFAISHTACEKTIKQTSNERARERERESEHQ